MPNRDRTKTTNHFFSGFVANVHRETAPNPRAAASLHNAYIRRDMPHHGASLSCHHPRSIETLFPTSSADWSARDVAMAVERVRARAPPVRFYLYDEPVLPVSVRRELDRVERCGMFGPSGKQYHYGGEYWFLRSLIDHPWRVANASEAELLVIPSLFSF